jgi:hypothetical protein
MSDILSTLDDHGFDSETTDRKVAMVNAAYYDICSREPWPFLEKTIALAFDGSAAVATNWPADFRSAWIIQITSVQTAGPLKFIRYDDWLQSYGASPQTGTPQLAYFVANEVSFYPTPTADMVVTMGYLANPAALTDTSLEADILVPAQFHQAIVDGALYKLYAMEDDTDIAPTFETYFEREIQNMREQVWKRQYQTQDIVHPVDSDDLGLDGGWAYGVV